MSVHTRRQDLAKGHMGGTEETTTGVHRLRAMAADGKLLYPILAVNTSTLLLKESRLILSISSATSIPVEVSARPR
jgi:S-adenosylhomocysteine hydrolase